MIRNPFRSTRVRLTVVYALQFFVVITAASVGFWAASSQFEYSAVDASLRAQGNAVRATVEQSAPGEPPLLPPRSATGLPIDTFLVAQDGHLLSASAGDLTFQSVSALVPAGGFPAHAIIETATLRTGTVRVLLRQVTLGNASTAGLLLVRSIDDVRFRLAQSALLLGLIGAALLAACCLLAWRLAGRALRPVQEMSAAAREITQHDLHRRLPENLPANDEIGQLARTFNTMLERLDATFGSLQRFTADAAHELRAPLAIMKTKLEVTDRRSRTTAEYAAANAILLGEVERLTRVTNHLLLLARADAGALETHPRPVEIFELLSASVSRWRPVAAAAGIEIRLQAASGGHLLGDRDLLETIFDNLIDNAIRHPPQDGQILVAAETAGSGWKITIADSGPGISADIRSRLFERFSRGDPARGRSTGGAGLGLSICQAIAKAHGGSIELATESPLGGAALSIWLPSAAVPMNSGNTVPAGRSALGSSISV